MKYFRYFYFIASNWDIALALFTTRHEKRGEKKYGLDTLELINLRSQNIKGDNLKHSSAYQGANYFLLETAFKFLQQIGVNRSIVDFGCGRGRALVVAAYYGFSDLTGIEFAEQLYSDAIGNLETVKSKFPEITYRVFWEDAENYEVREIDETFFFFNPFDEIIMLGVVKNILSSLKKCPRDVYVVYLNPVHKEIFQSAGFEEIYYLQKLTYLELSILKLQAY